MNRSTGGDETDRFGRQRLIEGWRQDDLASATAVVVGVGALGNEVAKNLALAGIGRLVLCDPDTVEVSNLSRAVLFGPGDVGRAKVEAASAALRRISDTVTVDPRPAELATGLGLGEFLDADVVLGCLDSRRSRLQLLSRCALVDRPLIDGGTGSWGGEVRVRQNSTDPCYCCSLPPAERGESDLPRSCADVQEPGAEPASIAASALVASWMIVAALRLLLDRPVPYQILHVDGETGRCGPVGIARDPSCPHHLPLPTAPERLQVTHLDRVSTLLDALPPGSDPRAWTTFPVPSECPRCKAVTDYDQRLTCHVSQARPAVRCGRCGTPGRLRDSDRLAEADPAARLVDLGIPPQEIITVRTSQGEYRWVRLKG